MVQYLHLYFRKDNQRIIPELCTQCVRRPLQTSCSPFTLLCFTEAGTFHLNPSYVRRDAPNPTTLSIHLYTSTVHRRVSVAALFVASGHSQQPTRCNASVAVQLEQLIHPRIAAELTDPGPCTQDINCANYVHAKS